MSDGRRRHKAKQARRDARRVKARRREALQPDTDEETPEETSLVDEVRAALDGGQPLDLLGLVSMLIQATSSQQPFPLPATAEQERTSLDELVAAFVGTAEPETTALLAVLGEMLAPDDPLSARSRAAVAARDDDLPGWITGLSATTVHRAVLMTHVLGDGDELLLGVRLADGHELTCAVFINHLMLSEVKDAFFVPEPIDTVLAVAHARNDDPDTSFTDIDPADARVRLHRALDQRLPFALPESETWPAFRPVVQWLARLMPAGGSDAQAPHGGVGQTGELLDRFFGTPQAGPFGDIDHRHLLQSCIEQGTRDPLRWSSARLEQLLHGAPTDDSIPMRVQVELPELLRAFVPFAHAEAGIRQELTDEALTAIDESADVHRATLLDEDS